MPLAMNPRTTESPHPHQGNSAFLEIYMLLGPMPLAFDNDLISVSLVPALANRGHIRL